jgi:hypothetical protein
MDPYIEGCGLWEDFHPHLIEKIYERLADAVPERYLVRTGERSYLALVEPEGKASHAFLPDVGVTSPTGLGTPTESAAGVALAESATEPGPVTLRALIEEEYRETFIEIYESSPGQRLVTSIEVLSPSNKRRSAPGWEIYLRKRQALLLGRVNLVEIDLLRGGQRMPMLDPWPNSPYTLLVYRGSMTQLCQVWPGYFHRPLPPIPVPLAKPDSDISLSLQPLIEAIYQRSRYERSIDYGKPLTGAPLRPEEATWLEQLRGQQPPA